MENCLKNYIQDSFKNGLSYNEAAQLCLRLYSSVDGLPVKFKSLCNKDDLSIIFADLATSGLITGSTLNSAIYGANFHEVTDKGHWIEVIASIFKNGDTVDIATGNVLMAALSR